MNRKNYFRIETLESELVSRRQSDHTENVNLEKAMEQVEDNLKRSTVSSAYQIFQLVKCKTHFKIFFQKRAINAESTVASLKKEIDSLSVCIINIFLKYLPKL